MKKSNSTTESKKAVQASATTANEATAQQPQSQTPSKYRKLPSTPEEIAQRKSELAGYDLVIQYRKSFGKWYVSFKGVRPELNVGLPFKTADKAFKYAMLLKNRYNAILPGDTYAELATARKAELDARPEPEAKAEDPSEAPAE